MDEYEVGEKTSKLQRTFVRRAKKQGFEVVSYSGKFMFGTTCPAIVLTTEDAFENTPSLEKHMLSDSLGLDTILYLPR